MSSSVVGQVLHFQKTNLIQTSCEDIDYMTVVCGSLGQVVVELCLLAESHMTASQTTYLDSLLIELDVIPVNIMMGTNRFLQLGRNNVARPFRGWTTGEGHDAPSGILERSLQQPNGDAQSNTSAAKGSLVVGHGPGIALQLFEDVGYLELGLLDGQQETRRRTKGRAIWLLLRDPRPHAASKTQHLLHLSGTVLLVAAEHVGLGALGVSEFVNLGLHRGQLHGTFSGNVFQPTIVP